MITPATPIRGQGGNPLRDKGRAVEHAGQFLPPGMDAMTNTYLLELSRVCATEGLNYRVAVAQWDLETDSGRSPRWVAHRNPAGLGIERDGDPDPATWTGEEAARVHAWALAHASDPTLFPPPGFLPTSADPFVRRWVDKYADPHCPIVRTVADLNRRYADRHGEMQATWAWDPDYPLKIVSRANAIFKEESMPIVARECPIEIAVEWDGPNRPGLPMSSPSKIVNHEVGNKSPGADEEMHKRFVQSGGGQFNVSFHFVVGPTKILQLLYLDENAWHASDGYTGDGNRDAWGIEHIQIGDFDLTLAHSAYLQAELARNPRRFAIKRPEQFIPDISPANVRQRMVRHYDEAPDRKWCPEIIMNTGQWEPLRDAVHVAANTPLKPEPFPITWEVGAIGVQEIGAGKALAMVGEVTAKRNVPLRQAASSSAPVVHRLKQGERAKIVGTFRTRDGRRWAFIEFDEGKVGRALMSAFNPAFPTL